jgi:nicotinamidase/pyrazinamidase
MGNIVFWDVDTQHDFMDPNGKLSVPGASSILNNLERLTKTSLTPRVMSGSIDAHIPRDLEFREWPEHCVYGTPGQRKIPESTPQDTLYVPSRKLTTKQLKEVITYDKQVIFEKQHNDVRTNPNAKVFLESINPEQILVYGVATDVCVDLAVKYIARDLGYKVIVVTDAIKEIDPAKGKKCLAEWRNLGVQLQKTEELLKR